MPNEVMPPKMKATKVTKKGKAPQKWTLSSAPIHSDMEWTSRSEEEDASV